MIFPNPRLRTPIDGHLMERMIMNKYTSYAEGYPFDVYEVVKIGSRKWAIETGTWHDINSFTGYFRMEDVGNFRTKREALEEISKWEKRDKKLLADDQGEYY